MLPCSILLTLLLLVSISTTSIVIEVHGDCPTLGHRVAQEHGYRYVRQIFAGFCEIEEDPSSKNYSRHRRAIEHGMDPAHLLLTHEHVHWAESQVPKKRSKRESNFDDPEWNNMWYLMRHLRQPSLPDLNVTGAWQMGYTGRGHVVTFLDDGLEFDHPDLRENYDKDASTDINGNDDDPTPRYDVTDENKHGTRCAGEVAAKANNQICGVGIAYHARVGGIRMLDGDVTDSVEARSISHRPDHVDIYSASWGPDDNGLVVDGPGILAKKAFENGIRTGRDGKGSIFVWASGNGGQSLDSCACDGYITSIYTIAISSVSEHGNKPWYLEECSATLASAYSSGRGSSGEHDVITTDLHHSCTSHHTGTSAAAPLAAAIYALVLEANSDLTWRDIMYITVLGSRSDVIPSNTDLVHNAAGFNVSSRYGFGLMDAGLMTWYASGWKNVPAMSTCQSENSESQTPIAARSNETFPLNVTECENSDEPNSVVNYIEQVQVFVTLTTDKRGDMEIYLYSPSATKTKILPTRANDKSSQGFQDWAFATVQLWGESPHGLWKLQVVNTGDGSATLMSWRLAVHGTRDNPISSRISSNANPAHCHVECKPDQPCGSTDTSCTTCRHYKHPLPDGKFRCVGICPDGTYTSTEEKLCLPCHARCQACRNASETSCVSCKPGLFLMSNTMTCVNVCPKQYYTIDSQRKCVRCAANCESCDDRPELCTSCAAGYGLKKTNCVKLATKCLTSEYFDFDTNTCRWCDSRCLTCSGLRADQCTSCDPANARRYIEFHSCVLSCSPGFYLARDLSQCLPCYDTCLNCTSSSESACLSCKLGYVYLPDSHRCEKHQGKPFYVDSETGETHTCHASCTQCRGPKPNDCLACNLITEVLLDDGHCVNECPAGRYINENKATGIHTNLCLPCSTGCTACRGQNQCTQCDSSKGYTLKDQLCVPTCPTGLFLSKYNCEPCQDPCLTCTNLTSCLTCQQSLLLLNGQCLATCPRGYYQNAKQCLPCDRLCGTCTGPSENDCTSCTDGFVFNTATNKCTSICPNGNYYNKEEDACELCTDNCLECLAPGSFCRQCAYPMAFDTLTRRCSPCCSTDMASSDCCPCSLSWDGFCLHPLVNLSIQASNRWFQSPLNSLRNQFSDLDRSHQTKIIAFLIAFMCLLSICVVTLGVRQIRLSSASEQKHNHVEYVMLENLVDEDDDGNHDDDDEETKFDASRSQP